MKRTLAILLALCMIFVLCACGAAETTPVSESVAEESVSADESSVDLQILMEEDDSMINTYSLLAVNPDANFVDADGNAVADVELTRKVLTLSLTGCSPKRAKNWPPTMATMSTESTCSTVWRVPLSPRRRSPKQRTRPRKSASPLRLP